MGYHEYRRVQEDRDWMAFTILLAALVIGTWWVRTPSPSPSPSAPETPTQLAEDR